ncbi:MAG: hypothetical protein CME06_01010 [Gemmatimonadetes bacterium]|nr:hypothetical protein [Gemmatimonadota bacterium]
MTRGGDCEERRILIAYVADAAGGSFGDALLPGVSTGTSLRGGCEAESGACGPSKREARQHAQAAALAHYAPATEAAYLGWTQRFFAHLGQRNAVAARTSADVRAFLSHLAIQRHLGADELRHREPLGSPVMRALVSTCPRTHARGPAPPRASRSAAPKRCRGLPQPGSRPRYRRRARGCCRPCWARCGTALYGSGRES